MYLDKGIIIEAINCQIESLIENKFDNFFKIKRLMEQIEILQHENNPLELLSKGGRWLGAAREWMQWNCINGSDVIWGSDEYLKFNQTLTVRQIEYFAAKIASATLNDY